MGVEAAKDGMRGRLATDALKLLRCGGVFCEIEREKATYLAIGSF